MTWKRLLDEGLVVPEPPRRAELDDLRLLAERYLADSRVDAVSTDGRFVTAYEAARVLAKMVVRASGYRIRATEGAHLTTFRALEATDPARFARHAVYFDRCRAKRNSLSYHVASVATESELQEILSEVPAFAALVNEWLAEHPAVE